MTTTIRFLGASGTVTGSKYLVKTPASELLIDLGLFQGSRDWREKNWNKPPIELSTIDAVLLTHAHIDHTGLIPRYYREGLRCPIYASRPTEDLCRLLLPDSGRLQEEEASYRSKYDRSRHHPPLPLYTEEDARNCLELLRAVEMSKPMDIPNTDCKARWDVAGHILGAATLTLETPDGSITFSGDLGRYNDPVILPPTQIKFGKLLLVESTYGDRFHDDADVEEELGNVVRETSERGGVLVIPSFAVGRTQSLLYFLRRLKESGRITDLPIIIDSPMATDATEIYLRHQELLGPGVLADLAKGIRPFSPSKLAFTRDREQSKFINKQEGPFIVISASGMLTGGRILHHLMHRLGDPKNTILFVGFQPPGSKGDLLQSGIKSLRLMKEEIPVRAQVRTIGGLSAHGDQRDLLRWCSSGDGRPDRVMVLHGEPGAAKVFSEKLSKDLNWNSRVAKFDEEITL